jgi:CDP-diacylglycerol--inositol 3-phosphatidyltransferase
VLQHCCTSHLPQITDRFCTAALLGVLAHLYPTYQFVFTCLMILDVVSHWVQMYSSLAAGSSSHKSLADEWALLRFYYTFPYALFFVCLFNETFLAFLFLAAHEPAVTAAT